jgi:hypothetical protein
MVVAGPAGAAAADDSGSGYIRGTVVSSGGSGGAATFGRYWS